MNVEDAAHLTGHEYPGGAKALAARMGINQVVFNSKLNPNTTTHHLTLREAVRLQQLAGTYHILHAMADELEHVCIPRPQIHDEDMTHALTTACAEFGDFLRQIDACMQDGRVTANEVKRIDKELLEMIAAANHLRAILAGKIGKR